MTSACAIQSDGLSDRSDALQDAGRRVAAQLVPPFRGEIHECYKHVPMGRGFANEGAAFDIETACYLKPVQRAIRERPYGKFVILAAVQMLKTNGAIEQPAGYFIQHDPGDMTIYLSGDDSAFDQAKARLMPFIKSVPGVASIIEAAEANNRFDITTAEFYLPTMVLRVWPLNETTTQRITLRFVLISDAFLSKKTGMIGQACARTTQHNTHALKDYKIIIESQGGDEGDDFDTEWKSTDMRILHVVCPCCGGGQPFEWTRERPDDFMPTPLLTIPSLDHTAWIEHNRPLLLKADAQGNRRSSGMKRGDDDLIKREDGSFNEAEVMRQTYYECFHCGSAWRDTPLNRSALDYSSYYVASNQNALPENIGFWWPAWAGQRLAWGGEFNMLGYLRAKVQQEKFGDDEPLKQWYQKRAARPWNPNIEAIKVASVTSSADLNPEERVPDELFRQMKVDCQQHKALSIEKGQDMTGHFWFEASATSKTGRQIQLARGYATSWEEWIETYKRLKIPVKNVSIDGAFKPDEVKAMAAKHAEIVTEKDGRRVWATWTMMLGDDAYSFKWPDGVYREYSPARLEEVSIMINNTWVTRKVNVIRWSNFRIKNILHAILNHVGGAPEYVTLPKGSPLISPTTRQMEQGDFTWDNQMTAEILGQKSKANTRPIWLPRHKQKHYRDCLCMGIVKMLQAGMLGTVAAPKETAQSAGED